MPESRTDFWMALDHVVAETELVVDRAKGTAHPRYPHLIYPLDYGYLDGTSAMDGGGIDIWRGSEPGMGVVGVICTIDLVKRDSEIKLLIACSETEISAALAFHNNSDFMKGLLIRRPRM